MKHLKKWKLFEEFTPIFQGSKNAKEDRERFIATQLDFLKGFISRADLFDKYPDIWFYLTFSKDRIYPYEENAVNKLINNCDSFTDDESDVMDDLDWIIEHGQDFKPNGLPWEEYEIQKSYDRLWGYWWARIEDIDGDVVAGMDMHDMQRSIRFPEYHVEEMYPMNSFVIMLISLMRNDTTLDRMEDKNFDPGWVDVN
jgi:hypothetical protein